MVDWNAYINRPVTCSCGRRHECDIKHIIVEKGAIRVLPDYIKAAGYKNVCIVADRITNRIAAEKVTAVLEAAAISYQKVILQEDFPLPNEQTIGSLLVEISPATDLIVAVGSGTVNDLCRFISSRMKIKYFIVGTAPSMDGYASDVAPLIIRGVKTTYEKLNRPQAIIGDTDILKAAPLHMINAGVGDVFGKYIALTEWKLAHIITGEYYCPYIVEIMQKAVAAVADAADHGLTERNEAAIGAVMDGLILSGIGMCYAGNSRPASGSEHHMSHFWEMKLLADGRHEILHGTKVGINTLIAILLYQKLRSHLQSGKTFSAQSFDETKWTAKMREIFGDSAPVVLELEQKTHKNAFESIAKRVAALNGRRQEILAAIEEIPDFNLMLERMKKLQAAYRPSQIHVSQELVEQSILYAKEIRNRYAILQLLFDIGKLEAAAKDIAAQSETW